MKKVGRVQGSKEMAVPLVIGKTTVYEHENIVQITEDKEGKPVEDLYEYDETQYDVSEYLTLQAQRNADVEAAMDTLLTDIIPNLDIVGGE